MALLSELSSVIAEVEGLPEPFVSGVARYLREAGLIRQAGRGRGAANMTPQDAACLLIGVNGTGLAKDVVQSVHRFSDASWFQDEDMDASLAVGDLSIFSKSELREGNLAYFVAKLVSSAIPDETGYSQLQRVFGVNRRELQLGFRRPAIAVNLTITEVRSDKITTILSGVFFGKLDLDHVGDRTDTVAITHKTILEVGKVLAS